MKFNIGDIVEIHPSYKRFYKNYCGINKDELFLVENLVAGIYKCRDLPLKKYKFDFISKELQLALGYDLKEEDIL